MASRKPQPLDSASVRRPIPMRREYDEAPDGSRFEPEYVALATTLSAETLAYYRATGQGPKFAKVGAKVCYRKRDVESWLAKQGGRA